MMKDLKVMPEVIIGKNYLLELKIFAHLKKYYIDKFLDLYAPAVDYDPKDSKSIEFFKIVQNKLHFAAHGHTASEVIYERADSNKPFMGLTTFAGDLPIMSELLLLKII